MNLRPLASTDAAQDGAHVCAEDIVMYPDSAFSAVQRHHGGGVVASLAAWLSAGILSWAAVLRAVRRAQEAPAR